MTKNAMISAHIDEATTYPDPDVGLFFRIENWPLRSGSGSNCRTLLLYYGGPVHTRQLDPDQGRSNTSIIKEACIGFGGHALRGHAQSSCLVVRRGGKRWKGRGTLGLSLTTKNHGSAEASGSARQLQLARPFKGRRVHFEPTLGV